jgi:inner membrane protein
VVPYSTVSVDNAGRQMRSAARAYFLPRDVQIEGQVEAEERRRGIFEVPVYRATLKVKGRFARPDFDWVRPAPERIDWERASVVVGLSDPRGVGRRALLQWRGQQLPFAGAMEDAGLFGTGLRTAVGTIEDVNAGADLRSSSPSR